MSAHFPLAARVNVIMVFAALRADRWPILRFAKSIGSAFAAFECRWDHNILPPSKIRSVRDWPSQKLKSQRRGPRMNQRRQVAPVTI
jgi:hypothetical protein